MAHISSIMSNDGLLLYEPFLITREFQHFYMELYSSEEQCTRNNFDTFFDGLSMPMLSSEDATSLDSPITLDDLYAALKDMNRGNSPG